MNKYLLTVVILVTLSLSSFGQRSENLIGLAIDIGYPIGEFGVSNSSEGFETGYGGTIKALFGIAKGAHLTVTSGYSSFKLQETPTSKLFLKIIPVLAGFRRTFYGFYVEPQAGVGIYKVRSRLTNGFINTRSTTFLWAAGIGYTINGIDVGLRYQSGEYRSTDVKFIGLKLGYNFSS